MSYQALNYWEQAGGKGIVLGVHYIVKYLGVTIVIAGTKFSHFKIHDLAALLKRLAKILPRSCSHLQDLAFVARSYILWQEVTIMFLQDLDSSPDFVKIMAEVM